MTTSADAAVLIGRFQPFHSGHASLLKRALAAAPRVIIVLGSALGARSAKNPFTWQERAAMIGATLAEADRPRVSYVALRDYYDDARWSAALRRAVEAQAGEGAQGVRIALVGHFKDASSYYLNHFPQWQLIAAENDRNIDATRIRCLLFEADHIDAALDAMAELVPVAVRQCIRQWAALPHYAALQQECRQLAGDQAAWRAAPYPPIFSTVDALVRAAGHVLLIQRGGFPGKGLWALPGGFVEPRERLLAGALRELREETGLAVADAELARALVEVRVFDHPERSQRGRTITHVHYFDLPSGQLPAVAAADDAALACWVPVERLAGMEEAFFEDHFHILDQFLHLIDA